MSRPEFEISSLPPATARPAPVPLNRVRSVASPVAPHAVARLRTARLARSTRPFLSRGGPKGERCEGCRLRPSHCLCRLRPTQATQAGVCLLMHDAEPLKPSNTGWLIADVVADTWAFGWSRTDWDAGLLALLDDPQWQPYVVFPGEGVEPPSRVVSQVPPEHNGKRPLLILLDATWTEARKMFRKSPYLERFPVLSLQAQQLSRYRLRHSGREDHFCTAEVAALCLELTGDARAAQTLEAYLDVYSHHYLRCRDQLPPDWDSPAHQQLAQAQAQGQAR